MLFNCPTVVSLCFAKGANGARQSRVQKNIRVYAFVAATVARDVPQPETPTLMSFFLC